MAGTQDSRIRIKRSTTAGQVPTVPASSDHTDGTWSATDIYIGELFMNTADGKLFTRTDDGIVQLSIGTDSVIYEATLAIPSADVLTLNATPLEIVAAPGAGKAIDVVAMVTSVTLGTVAYATNTNLYLVTDTATIAQAGDSEILKSTVARTLKGTIVDPAGIGSTDTIIIANKALLVSVQTGNPTAGDADLTVKVLYRIISI